MRILILEDNPLRIEKFKELFKNQQVTHCSDISNALIACRENDYSVLWLDHDLGGKIWEDSFNEPTGYRFVKAIVDENLQRDALIYIHSMNPIGANLMLNYLKDNDYDGIWIPFHLLKIEDK
jgi:CheY-like chemotaxis protein